MRAILDTRTFLWWITDSELLGRKARQILRDPENELYLSAASGWEIAIKMRLGRITISGELESVIPEQMATNAILGLPIHMSHALRTYRLPRHHRDPFDRILVAQAMVEDMPIITRDKAIKQYEVQTYW